MPLIKGQTISQPSTIAAMLENLQVRKDQKVLEIGSGCGYVLALLSKIAGSKGKVFGIELLPELA
ncbi:MAG TPA: protein-L-isoaspartate carboxylmethyltransferase, partial [Candidatus Diapherotrites archaeon]|nr:protein-L-isoaspartate carboxylmethyltransferase [Candidatus Diapherotrites archaeon]